MPTRTALSRLAVAMAALCCAVTAFATTACDDGGLEDGRSPVEDLVSPSSVPGAAELSQDAHGAARFTTAGVADVRTGRRILPTDHFRAGSITKTVIATVVLQLAAEHRLGLDDPVADHLPPSVSIRFRHSRITVRQLLTHTSGLFSYTDDRVFFREFLGPGAAAHRFASHAPESLVRTGLAHPPYAPPGTRYHYSNTDYLLLGMVIRQVTGRSYAAEARRRILTPLHLTGTSFPGTRITLPAPHGRAYSSSGPGGPTDVTDLNPSAAGAAGELVSTLPDLNRFFGALFRGALLPTSELGTIRDTAAAHGRHGMGLFPVRLPCGVTLWGHNGAISGSYVQVLGTADGRHVVSYRLNSDTRIGGAAEERLLTAEFC